MIMHPHLFSRGNFFLLVVLALLAVMPQAKAVTATGGAGSRTATMTANYNVSTGAVDWSYSHNGADGTNGAGVQMRLVVANGSYSGTTYVSNNWGGGSTDSGSIPGATIGLWIFVQAGASGPDGMYDEKWEEITPADPCKAKFPATTNSTGYAVHYRLVHSTDGVVATVIVPPGTSVPAAEYDVTCGGTYHIEWQSPDADAAAGLVTDGTWGTVEGTDADPDAWNGGGGPEYPDYPEHEPPDAFPPEPTPHAPDGTPLPEAPKPPAPPWKPTDPTVDNERLDKSTYKQGIDKVVGELQVQTDLMKGGVKEGTFGALVDAAVAASKAAADVAAAAINDAAPGTPSTTTGTSTTEAGATDTLYTANIPGAGPGKLLGGNTIAFKPSMIAPDWKTYGAWMREAMLFVLGLSFAWFMQKKFERYYMASFMVTEKTTRTDAPSMVPPVGWGKQGVTALAITAAIVVCISATIVMINSNLATLLGSGTNIVNVMAGLNSQANSIFTAIDVIYKFMNVFIPIPAIMQFGAFQFMIAVSMPFLWTTAFAAAKFVHV